MLDKSKQSIQRLAEAEGFGFTSGMLKGMLAEGRKKK